MDTSDPLMNAMTPTDRRKGMSLECSECERDMRGPHDENCSRHPKNRPAAPVSPVAPAPQRITVEMLHKVLRAHDATFVGPGRLSTIVDDLNERLAPAPVATAPVTDDNPDIREIAFDFIGDLGLPEHRSKEWLGGRTERLIKRIVSVVNKYRVAPVATAETAACIPTRDQLALELDKIEGWDAYYIADTVLAAWRSIQAADRAIERTQRLKPATAETAQDAKLPKCSWEYVGGEELAIFWESPYGHGKEKIASFWWPQHPVEATSEVERIFESFAERLATPPPQPAGTPQRAKPQWGAEIAARAEFGELEDDMPPTGTPEPLRELAAKVQTWANNCAVYKEQSERENHVTSHAFHRGAEEAYQRVSDELATLAATPPQEREAGK